MVTETSLWGATWPWCGRTSYLYFGLVWPISYALSIHVVNIYLCGLVVLILKSMSSGDLFLTVKTLLRGWRKSPMNTISVVCQLLIRAQTTVNATPSPELGSHSTWSWSSSVAIFCSLVVVGRQSINESVVDKDLIVNSGCLGGYCIFILESRRLIWELEGEWVLFTLLSWILLIICGGLDKERGHSLSRQCTPPTSLANNPTW